VTGTFFAAFKIVFVRIRFWIEPRNPDWVFHAIVRFVNRILNIFQHTKTVVVMKPQRQRSALASIPRSRGGAKSVDFETNGPGMGNVGRTGSGTVGISSLLWGVKVRETERIETTPHD